MSAFKDQIDRGYADCVLVVTRGILDKVSDRDIGYTGSPEVRRLVSHIALALPFPVAIKEEARLDMSHAEIVGDFGDKKTTPYLLSAVLRNPDAFIAHCLLLGDIKEL